MTYHQIAAAACASLALGCAPATTSLDRLIGFADPKNCEPNEAFSVLLNSMLGHEQAGESYTPVLRTPLVPAEFRHLVGTPQLKIEGNEYQATLPLRGTWQGLPLRSVMIIGWIESETGFELSFDADPTQVLATVNRLGFDIPSSGSVYRDDEVLGLYVVVSEYEGGATLSCIPA